MSGVENPTKVKVFCDGGSRGNPGPSASGVVFLTTDDELLHAFHRFLGVRTNNYAEYDAVILALEQLHEEGIEEADMYLDSELVTRQLIGQYRVKHPDLKPLFARVKELEVGLTLTYTHVLREFNKLADEQVNICLDART